MNNSCDVILMLFLFFVDVHDYSTPGISTAVPILVPDSVTPRTQLQTVRLIQPSKSLLPPFSYTTTTDEEDALYKKVIIHAKGEKKSRIKEYDLLLHISLPVHFYVLFYNLHGYVWWVTSNLFWWVNLTVLGR
jgi:hypothetical protein